MLENKVNNLISNLKNTIGKPIILKQGSSIISITNGFIDLDIEGDGLNRMLHIIFDFLDGLDKEKILINVLSKISENHYIFVLNYDNNEELILEGWISNNKIFFELNYVKRGKE